MRDAHGTNGLLGACGEHKELRAWKKEGHFHYFGPPGRFSWAHGSLQERHARTGKLFIGRLSLALRDRLIFTRPLLIESVQNIFGTHPQCVWRGDGDRGQTKGLNREEWRRGGAQLEVGNGEDVKGGKRLRGQRGGTAKGKRPKGAGSPGRAEGSTGVGVVGEGDGTKTGKEKQNKNSYDFRESVNEHEQSEEVEARDCETE